MAEDSGVLRGYTELEQQIPEGNDRKKSKGKCTYKGNGKCSPRSFGFAQDDSICLRGEGKSKGKINATARRA